MVRSRRKKKNGNIYSTTVYCKKKKNNIIFCISAKNNSRDLKTIPIVILVFRQLLFEIFEFFSIYLDKIPIVSYINNALVFSSISDLP